ncbi:winged helix-turn-helix domain-containing protein [Kribbella sp. NBC_01505]|uniref:AfsR/SARP family transcriptional regulator n=1 Tax=Kribbella sp. NBC_01505 TaxID=2903580 RepID=UPI003869C6F6
MRFAILGPLLVHGSIMIESPVRRAILTALLLRAGQIIGVSQFADLLWDDPPASAGPNIRSHLTGLRRDLNAAEPGLGRQIKTYRGGQSGYGLQIGPDELDLAGFTHAARHGRATLMRGDLPSAVGSLEQAVAFWRGPFGEDLPPTRWFAAHVTGINNVRFDALQDLFAAYILANRTHLLCYRIESVIAEAPYRQRLWELLAAAHCINGDAANALSVIERCRVVFAEELGLDLPPGVEAMQAAVRDWDRDRARSLVAAHAPERGFEPRWCN